MRRAFTWILGILVSPIVLFLVLAVVIYMPPVQRWMVAKVADVASEQTGMDISVGDVRLAFPLDLAVNEVLVVHQPDTIADMECAVVDVQLLPLISGRVVVNELELRQTRLNTNGFVDAAQVRGKVGRLFLTSRGVDLGLQSAELNGARIEDAQIDITLNDSVPEDTTTSETLWKIHADKVTIHRTDVALHMPGDSMSVGAHFGTLEVVETLVDLESQTYTVQHVGWQNGAISYDQNYQPEVEGLDYNHLRLSNISAEVDSVYFSDPTLRLSLRHLALREKCGLQLTDLSGTIAMQDGSILLPQLRLLTPMSDMTVELNMPLSVTDSISPGSMRAHLDARIGKDDVVLLLAGLPQDFRQRWPDEPLQVSGAVSGNMRKMDLQGLELSLPTAFHVSMNGFAANLDDLRQLNADVNFKAETGRMDFVMGMLSRDMRSDYRIPAGLRAEGRLRADGATYQADVTVNEGKGMVKVQGSLNADAMRYDASMEVCDLNIHHFMPRDSIHTVSAMLTAQGQGIDFLSPKTTLTADVVVERLRYGQWNLDDMAVAAKVRDGHALATLNSHNELLKGVVSVDALLNRKKVEATTSADIKTLDLYKLYLTDKPLSIGMCGQMDISSDMKLTHYVSGLISDITVSDSVKTVSSEFVGLHLNLTPDTTIVRAQSGDFIIKLDGSGSYEQLLSQCQTLADTIGGQYSQRVIDQPALMRLLPTVKLHIESKQDNPVATLLKTSQNIDFKDLLASVTSSPVIGLNGKGYIHALTVSDIRLDTINFRLTQRREHLSFGGQIRNNKQNPKFVFNALFDGVLQQRGATIGVRYFDSGGKLGARIGAQAEMVDSGLRIHLVPERPTIGYKEFALNADNFLLLGANNRVQARIDLVADDGTGAKIYSEDSNPVNLQDLTVSLNRIDLGELTSVMPYYMPRMTGVLNGDFHVVQDADRRLSVVSDMDIRGMTYERSPIGNVSTELVYLQKENAAHAIEARLLRDSKEIGQLTGTFYDEGEGSLDARMLLERMPLSMVNGFIPDQLFGLQGYAEGEMSIRGPLSKPLVDGEVYLDSSYVESIPYGVTLRFDNDPVRIVASQLLFENFTVYAHNENPLNVQGSVNFSDPERVKADVRMRARNIQLIGVKENPKSVAYGKAFFDIFATMRGPLDDLTMRGRLNVLASTDMGYILRDTPLSTDNQLDNLVKFTDFSDTAKVVVEHPPLSGLTMDMTVDVSKGAHIIAYLNSDHSNYIDLLGGGVLRMRYNPADNLQLTGRYTLSNGEMKYALPIIPLKTFTIRDGSYIEFTGVPMNPTLNITATERIRAAVTGTDGAGRSVDFDCGVVITKTLNDMGLEFTLDAPEDMQLHGELQAMGPDQRGKLAVTMLTTGMYLADGQTNAFSMNTALSSFLSSEISSLTGNALRTMDLSFGMDNSTDATGNTSTDYSFKFAKRFLNNRLKVAVGGKVTTGAEMPQRNKSFFDNVSLEYRLDDTANKYLSLFYENNSYDWLDGYTQKYGGGFIWRRKLQRFWDIFSLSDRSTMFTRPLNNRGAQNLRDSVRPIPSDSLKTTHHDQK